MRTISARVGELWPRLRVPVYGTRFTIALLKEKLSESPGARRCRLSRSRSAGA